MVMAITIQMVTTMVIIAVSSFPSEDSGPGATRAGCVSDATVRPQRNPGRKYLHLIPVFLRRESSHDPEG